MATERKNFFKDYKLFSACEKPESALRENLERVYFHNGCAYASDAHILVRVPLSYCTSFEEEQIKALDGFCIHGKILKMIYGFDVVTVERTTTTEDAYGLQLETPETAVYIKAVYQGEEVRFRLEKSDREFVSNFDRILATESGHRPLNKVGVDTGSLHRISEALNMSSVLMNFTTAENKIFIRSVMEEDQKSGPMAIILPIAVEPTLPGMGPEDAE